MIPEEYSCRNLRHSPLYISVGASTTLTSVYTFGSQVEANGRNLPGIRWGQTLELTVEPHHYPLRRVTLSVFARFAGENENFNKSIGHCTLFVNERAMQTPAQFTSSLVHMGLDVGSLQVTASFQFTSYGNQYVAHLDREAKTAYRPFASIRSQCATSDVPTLRSMKSAGSGKSSRSMKSTKSFRSTTSQGLPSMRGKMKSLMSIFKSKGDDPAPIAAHIPPVIQMAAMKEATMRSTATSAKAEASPNAHPSITRAHTPVISPHSTTSQQPSHFRQFSNSSSLYHKPTPSSFSPYTQTALDVARDTQSALKERRVSRSNPNLKSRGTVHTDYTAEVVRIGSTGFDSDPIQPLLVRKSRQGHPSTAGSIIHMQQRKQTELAGYGMRQNTVHPSQQSAANSQHANNAYGDYHPSGPQPHWSQSKLLRNEWQDENLSGFNCQHCGIFNQL